jgi:hypothetical protein
LTHSLARHAAFLAAGLLATAAQVLLLRELVVDAAGDEAAIGIGLAAWLVGIAGGAAAARHRRAAAAPGDAATGLALLALLPPLGILGGRLLRLALAPSPGELPGLGLALLISLATLAPSGAGVGWTFTALAASASRLWEAGEGIARVYVVESLGSLLGGAVVTLLAGAWLPPFRLSALVGAAGALLALAAVRGGTVARPWRQAAAALACLALAVAASPLDGHTERGLRARPPACRCGPSSTPRTSISPSAETTCCTSTRAGSTRAASPTRTALPASATSSRCSCRGRGACSSSEAWSAVSCRCCCGIPSRS